MAQALIRADASPNIGKGHIYRCLSLAYGLQENGFDICFLTRKQKGDLTDLIESKGFKVLSLPPPSISFNEDDYATWLGSSIEQDYNDCAQLLQGQYADLLIVDHYAITTDWTERMREYAKHILFIDDLANRPFHCDYLLNQNIGFTAEDYQPLVPAECNLMLGTEYALLRKEFAEYKDKAQKRRIDITKVEHVLLSAEVIPYIDMESVIKILNREKINELTIVGESELLNDEATQPLRVHQLGQVKNIAEYMLSADFAIGGAGSATWERCCLGLPSAVLVLAENQARIAQSLEDAHAGWHLNSENFTYRLADILPTLNRHAEIYNEYAINAVKLCDGNGVNRVCKSIDITTK